MSGQEQGRVRRTGRGRNERRNKTKIKCFRNSRAEYNGNYADFQTHSVTGGEGPAQPEDPKEGPRTHCIRSPPDAEKEKVSLRQVRSRRLWRTKGWVGNSVIHDPKTNPKPLGQGSPAPGKTR